MADARTALKVLETDGFTNENVSVVTHKDHSGIDELGKIESRRSESPPVSKSTGIGAAVGGSIATPLATASMVGPLLVAGPLAGIIAGGVVGGLLSGTDRWGVDHQVAKEYEDRIAAGSVVIVVHDEDEMRVSSAETLLKTCDHVSLKRFHTK